MERKENEREIIVRLFQISNVLQTFIDRLLKPFGITSKQFFIMIIIGSFDDHPTLGEIAQRFKTSHQNVKQVLLKLEKLGFVHMYKDNTDTRITRTWMTEKAVSFWSTRNHEDDIMMTQIFKALDLNQLKQFNHALVTTMQTIKEMNSGD